MKNFLKKWHKFILLLVIILGVYAKSLYEKTIVPLYVVLCIAILSGIMAVIALSFNEEVKSAFAKWPMRDKVKVGILALLVGSLTVGSVTSALFLMTNKLFRTAENKAILCQVNYLGLQGRNGSRHAVKTSIEGFEKRLFFDNDDVHKALVKTEYINVYVAKGLFGYGWIEKTEIVK
ncbi:MAG: hypothetical protein MJZ23_02305 [Paludibacteraceae bacterium]|nr:hypothetical protein [Paludibacteraceae bacterium]